MSSAGLLASLAALAASALAAADPPPGRLALHAVPTPIKSHRLLAMSRDDNGYVWAGSVHHAIHRYDPRTGGVKTVPLPARATASACICAGGKVYVLGQSHPRLIVYDRTTETFTEKDYPSPKPDVWYGTGPVGGRHLYLFDRGGAGVIKWDTRTDTGKAVRWPYEAPLPSSGEYVAGDNAVWCRVWDLAGGKYVPVGLARLDARTDEFTGFYPFPKGDADLKPYADPEATFFLPDSLKGRLVPFDFEGRRWCRSVPVPGYGERFGFIGGPTVHRGRLYFPLSTYDGDDVGCDGGPYHFLNSVLAFDPATRTLHFLTPEARGGYYQIAYLLNAGGELFATGTNIREPGGRLNRDRAGEVVVWQTTPPERK